MLGATTIGITMLSVTMKSATFNMAVKNTHQNFKHSKSVIIFSPASVVVELLEVLYFFTK